MQKEVWRAVSGFEGFYEVSNRGRVRSLFGRVQPLRRPHILVPRGLPNKYLRVQLFDRNSGGSDYYIHRLVAAAFVPNPLGLPFVNHLDGRRTNNHHTNLEWCTQKQNIAHALATGLMSAEGGEGNHAGSRLTDADVLMIRKSYDGKRGSIVELARLFNVSHGLVGDIIHRKRWAHL